MGKAKKCLECGAFIDESNSIDGYCEDCAAEMSGGGMWDNVGTLEDGFQVTESP